jgi:leader peptidase (prepilin peptidase) / N-methyltransferase
VRSLGALVGLCAVFGLAVGSFLNVVIYRVPRHLSIVAPRSMCPSCERPIRGWDNIPVISWVLLRGRCRQCGAAISARYPLVELATAALFAGTAARFGYDWALPAYLVLFAGLLALSWIDVEKLILPRAIVYPLLVLFAVLLTVAAAATGRWHDLVVGALCGAGWFVFFFLINLASPRVLGYGDVRLVPILGLALGWLGVNYLLLGFLAGNLIGSIIGIALIAAHRMDRQQPLPYGVFLAMGTAFAIFAGPELLAPFPKL